MQPDQQNPKGELGQIVEKLKSANNVLVTISTNPTVDQFAACIGLTLVLNKLGKHTNAVFSGAVPSTIDFLQPEKTIEKNTDSLRDFIIALDKSKADKLRYKVEDDVVKIFITPYRTSISEKDLKYSQGDFNVDAIVAIGVHERNQLDAAILAHGRILHDAVVISINTTTGSKLGIINWVDTKASSLCEMITDVAQQLSANIFDTQNSTALLTGIVAETDRYSNEKVTPHTMSVAGALMTAGASTQLVSTKLEEQKEEVLPPVTKELKAEAEVAPPKEEDGVIEIDHDEDRENQGPNQIEIDANGALKKVEEDKPKEDKPDPPEKKAKEKPTTPIKTRMISEPPSLGGQLTANSSPTDEQYSGSTDPMSNMPEKPLLKRTSDGSKEDENKQTLIELERSVGSPHANEVPESSVDEARDSVEQAADHNKEEEPPKNSPPPVPPPFVPDND